jgi:hypothetical protein
MQTSNSYGVFASFYSVTSTTVRLRRTLNACSVFLCNVRSRRFRLDKYLANDAEKGVQVPTQHRTYREFRRHSLPNLSHLLFRPEDGGDVFLRNVSRVPTDCTALRSQCEQFCALFQSVTTITRSASCQDASEVDTSQRRS